MNSNGFENFTLSDFYNMEIFERKSGTKSPLIDIFEGKKVGLVGYNAPEGLSDLEIKEDAFNYYQRLLTELKISQP